MWTRRNRHQMSGRLDDNLVGKLHGVLPPPLPVPKAIMLDLRRFWRSSQLKQSIWVWAVNGKSRKNAVKATIKKRASLHSNKKTLPETNSWQLKMDGWNTIVSFWDSLFSGAFAVSFREWSRLFTHEQFPELKKQASIYRHLKECVVHDVF